MTDIDREDWPVHQPAAPDAPIPGRHWYAGCDPDQPRVAPDGICEGCGESACPECGREKCPDHRAVYFTSAQLTAVAAVLGHALDQAHDDAERDYLQNIVDASAVGEEREAELERLLGGVLDLLP